VCHYVELILANGPIKLGEESYNTLASVYKLYNQHGFTGSIRVREESLYRLPLTMPCIGKNYTLLSKLKCRVRAAALHRLYGTIPYHNMVCTSGV
jgi:hypothetical protein